MEIDVLMQPLPVTENPGLEPFDPGVVEISTLAQNADYAGAASRAVEILDEGIFDIRVISFYLYGIFADDGPRISSTIFKCITALLTLNWEALGPVEKKEKHTQTSLNWLLKTLLKKLQSEETAKGDTWERWLRETQGDATEEALEAAAELQRSLGMALEDASKPVLDTLTKVVERLRSLQQLVYGESQQNVEAEPEEEQQGEQSETYRSTPATIDRGGEADATFVEGSYHLKELMKKLDLFERLVETQKFPRAAIVAADINTILAGFDPKLYFPKLFARFLYLFAVNASELLQYEENKETMEWQAMVDFYKVDMDGFLDM